MKKLTTLVLALGLSVYSLGCAKPTEESSTPAPAANEEAPADDAGSGEAGSDNAN